jgi:hypothetical protein
MAIALLKHYVNRLIHLGPRKGAAVIKNRLNTNFFQAIERYQARYGKAHHEWHDIVKKGGYKESFDVFFAQLKKKRFVQENVSLPDYSNILLEKADEYSNNCFSVLGSGLQCFNSIAWHQDFRLSGDRSLFDATAYYKDIHVKAGETAVLEKDIKVPWELSRFQHLFVLGKAYEYTAEQKYADTFFNHVSDWLDKNPYLLGPNWACPMDVALRALNWVVAFQFFNKANVTKEFWQRFVCSLYDHMLYLENNWEVYDTITSNHYLSDLIGYFYLCSFFENLPGVKEKLVWCYKELLQECEKQVFDEGTDYESTTNYHVLVTEIFYLFSVHATEIGFVLPDSFVQKLKKMFTFIDWCRQKSGNLVSIGDHDSGKAVAGLSGDVINMMKDEDSFGIKHFPSFGISIIKNETIHLSLRHHAFQKKQPTAHFHNDAGSMTLAIGDDDIFVDPGSYVYTPSAVWRNRFRSVQVHNTFYIKDKEPVAFDDRLFFLALPERTPKLSVDDNVSLETSHDLYADIGLRMQRKLFFDENGKKVTIIDRWQQLRINKNLKNLMSCWNFTLAPEIYVEKYEKGWLLKKEDSDIAFFYSALDFICIDGWHSPSYGVKVPAKRLIAQSPISENLIETMIDLL